MWAFALLLPLVAGLEIGLNGSTVLTGSDSSTLTSTLQPTSTLIVEIGSVTEPPNTITASASLPTPSCNTQYGRNCDRLPEQPYWFYISADLLTNSQYGFTVPSFRDPWLHFGYDVSQPEDLNATAEERSSAAHCQLVWANSTSSYKAVAPITYLTTVGPEGYTTTLTPTTNVFTDETVTGTGPATTRTDVFTYTRSSTEPVTETDIETETAPLEYGTIISTSIVTGSGPVTSSYAGYTAYRYVDDFTFVPPTTCCSACTLFGGSIEVMYWGTPTATDEATTVVNAAGFTFTSPSVYVALQTLSATDLCGEVGSDIVSGTTLSFAPGKLSTAIAYSFNNTAFSFYQGWSPRSTDYSAASFGKAECTDITTSFWMLGTDGAHVTYSVTLDPYTGADTTFTNTFSLTPYTLTYNPCKPYLSVAPEILAIDPIWSKCETYWQGFGLYDPPYILTPAHGLGGFSSSTAAPTTNPITAADPITSTSKAADPGPTAPSVTPDPTTVAPVEPTATLTVVPVVPPPADPTTAIATPAAPTAADPTVVESTQPVDPEPTIPVIVDPTQPAENTPATTVIPIVVDPTQPADPINTVAPADPASNPAPAEPATPAPAAPTTVPAAGDPATPDPATPDPAAPTFQIGTQTLAPGGPAITVSGTTFSLLPSGSSILVNNSPVPITDLLPAPTNTAPAFVVGTQTLIPGAPAITVSGTPVSLAVSGSSIVVGGDGGSTADVSLLLGSTTVTASYIQETGAGLAPVIVSVGGFDTGIAGPTQPGGVASNGTVPFTGMAGQRRRDGWSLAVGTAGVVMAVWFLGI